MRLIRLSLDGLTAFTTWPLRAVSILGFTLAALALLYGGYLTLSYFVEGNDVSGWTTIIVGLMLFAGIQLISVGILGEYIGRIFEEVKAPAAVRRQAGDGAGPQGIRSMTLPARPTAGTGPTTGHDVLLAILVFAWLAATAWARPLMLPDEGRYVGVAWEMMRSGDWITPTLNGLPYFHKPPLFYWITAGSMSVFGTNEWAARAAPLLGAWVAAMALYLFVRAGRDRRSANMTLLVLLAQPLFFGAAQFANLDMLVTGCITASIVLAAHAALCSERGLPYRSALAAAYAAAALGVLAKGLIGIVIPALIISAWLLARRRWRVLFALLWWPGIALFLLLTAPWFIAMQLKFSDFSYYFFVVQHFKRFAAGGFNNVQPFWFYPALLILFCAALAALAGAAADRCQLFV